MPRHARARWAVATVFFVNGLCGAVTIGAGSVRGAEPHQARVAA